MSLTLTREKQFAVLASILDVGGVGTKKEVLDNIDTKGYLFFDDKDLKIKHNRNELDWRNNLAFVRKGLVGNGCIDDPEWNQWAITDKGIEYLQDLCSMILMTSPTTFKKLTTISVKRATELTDEEGVEYQTRKSELQDDLNLANQVQQITTTRIKRYQAIVNKLKTIYQGRCQVDNCNFTFLKKDGTPYSEAHHPECVKNCETTPLRI